ncbi:hypothetical protein [Kineothrix sedimenti]|uniref:Uncharacterized protein n=1 Tax=Kineothrix sedimenti TaxID=3123317 RepID=A0ABZ3F050_9FIRM
MDNFYNDDIILTREATIKLLESLTGCDKEFLEVRNNYLNEIREKYSFRQEGECLIVNIPDLDLAHLESDKK